MGAFSNIIRTMRDRNWGGTDDTQVSEPYLNGYHFCRWWNATDSKLDEFLYAGNPKRLGYYKGGVSHVLSSTCLSVTPPQGTINKTEITGLGGSKWSVPTNIDYGTTITCKFLEMTGLPVFSIIHAWTKKIRENKSGLTWIDNPVRYEKSDYAATVFYWTTKPDGRTVEFASCYTGVFPTKDPQDLFAGDLSSVDKLEMDIEFNVDFIYHDQWVYDKCQKFANETKDSIRTQREEEGAIYNDESYQII